MQADTISEQPLIAWGVAGRTLPGQTVSGDLHLVKPLGDHVLLAAVDGLGHGKEAATAAKTALAVLAGHAEESLVALFKRCHEGLLRTRGVVMTAAPLRACE